MGPSAEGCDGLVKGCEGRESEEGSAFAGVKEERGEEGRRVRRKEEEELVLPVRDQRGSQVQGSGLRKTNLHSCLGVAEGVRRISRRKQPQQRTHLSGQLTRKLSHRN